MVVVSEIPVDPRYAQLCSQLVDRRRQLQDAGRAGADTSEVTRLLSEVDAALDRMRAGTYGICEGCHDPIEEERLLADPLVRFCLDHLNADQQRELEADLDLASQIQATLLPKHKGQITGWEICYHYEPAGPVGGDYCDLIRADDALLFILADVSGKGLAASMLVTHLHAIFHSLIPFRFGVAELVMRANRLLCESSLGSLYATLVCGRVTSTGAVEICNAGHLPPVLVKRMAVEELHAHGIPVGLFREATYSTTTTELQPGESLILYTDGLSEARNNGSEYGIARILKLAAECRDHAPERLIDHYKADLKAFLADGAREDDLTLLALKRAP